MNKILTLFLCAMLLLLGCSKNTARSLIEMELTDSYETSDPFVNEKSVYVSDDIDILKLNISFQMEGQEGILEIADNETDKVFWSEVWIGDTDNTVFSISLDNLEKEKEYVIRFTGTQIKYTKIVITSDNTLVKERTKPLKKNKN
ncbi:DUF4624 family lipoprotein [Blautia hominis]|uniref:DUF4624 family lipoprotein n=1 Tax=Blautia hominis TaxID=2025493 RepID=A0ABQ0BA36_9FIRM